MNVKGFWVITLVVLSTTACRKDRNIEPPPVEASDAGTPDGGTRDAGTMSTACPNAPIAPAASGTCNFTAGSEAILVRGDLVVPGGILENGHLLIAADGKIACTACDCSSTSGFTGATVIECAQGLVSPGLINAHDHMTFTERPPAIHTERYEHRHDWRRGQNGHTRIPSGSNRSRNKGILWGELRQLIAGATSVNGSGAAGGLMRNLDVNGAVQEGLDVPSSEYSTFPLGDSNGTRREMGCDYGGLDSPMDSAIRNAGSYTPHIAEGIGLDARNEFICLSRGENGGEDVVFEKTALIHGIGLLPIDYAVMAADRAKLIWSPRSNIDLYGHTAQVTVASHLGVRIALGTDWAISGSMSVLRELACADRLNSENYGSFFDDRELIDMATVNGAAALGVEDKLGSLTVGLEADIAIFDASQNRGYRAILDGHPSKVALVMRSGDGLYGDAALINGLNPSGCEVLDVCGTSKLLCVQRETNETVSSLRSAIANDAYDMFFCDPVPMNEPSCVPFRQGEFTGVSMPDDVDGDSIPNDRDNCPTVFNAPRLLDGTDQADADGDMIGDACDRCPLDAFRDDCSGPNPDDRDGDTFTNDMDNCPDTPNMDQSDRDMDMVGDACDRCPDVPNPGNSACLASVYAVKNGAATGRIKVQDVIVTASNAFGFFVQMPADSAAYDMAFGARFSGVFVFTNTEMNPAVGDRVDMEATVGTFFDQIQLSQAMISTRSSGNALPAPVVVTAAEIGDGGAREADYEAVLVEARDVMVTDIDPDPGPGDARPTNEFVVDGVLRVGDYLYRADPFPRLGDPIAFVRGVLRHANEHSKLEPRDMSDLGTTPTLRAFEPDLIFVESGSTATVGVVLTRTASAALTIQLASTSTIITVPASITIPAGMDRGFVTVSASSSAVEHSAMITGTHGRATAAFEARVFNDTIPRAVIAVSLDSPTVEPETELAGEVILNLPAMTGGNLIDFDITPALATVAGPITVQAGLSSTQFMLRTGTATGTARLTARVAGTMASVGFEFEVTSSVLREPGAGDLIITEVMYNPSTSEPAGEWFEVHNPTGDQIMLDGLLISDSRGQMRGQTISAPGLIIEPFGYAVLGASADTSNNGGVVLDAEFGNGVALNNSGDTVEISLRGTVIDSLAYTASWPGGNGTSMCLKFPYGDRTVSSSWSDSVGTFGSGQNGHPGVASDAMNCP